MKKYDLLTQYNHVLHMEHLKQTEANECFESELEIPLCPFRCLFGVSFMCLLVFFPFVLQHNAIAFLPKGLTDLTKRGKKGEKEKKITKIGSKSKSQTKSAANNTTKVQKKEIFQKRDSSRNLESTTRFWAIRCLAIPWRNLEDNFSPSLRKLSLQQPPGRFGHSRSW